MTCALRWAAMRAILIFHNCEGQSHKTVSTDHTFWRRAEADSNRGPSAYLPNAIPLGQTASRISAIIPGLQRLKLSCRGWTWSFPRVMESSLPSRKPETTMWKSAKTTLGIGFLTWRIALRKQQSRSPRGLQRQWTELRSGESPCSTGTI